jgi:hypothetical protein
MQAAGIEIAEFGPATVDAFISDRVVNEIGPT